MIQRPVKSQQITYVFPISSKMMPSILILVSYIKEDNREIVADSLKLKVKLALQNQVKIYSMTLRFRKSMKVRKN